HHPDGTVKARYEVDARGRKHGRYLALDPDGTVRLRADYRAGELHGGYSVYGPGGKLELSAHYRGGVLHGAYRTYHPNGKPHVTAAYRDGRRHGKYGEQGPAGEPLVTAAYRDGRLHGWRTVYRGRRRPASRQVWNDGRLRELNGITPYPEELPAMRRTLLEILGSEEEVSIGLQREALWTAPLQDRPKQERLAIALKRLKAYRYLAGVPWKDLELDAQLCRYAEAGARLCERVGRLSHTPPNPGLPAAEYRFGRTGTLNCNLSGGGPVEYSVDGYMNDSDPTNIGRLGHRGWCLSPRMLRTGFGYGSRFSAMWATDTGRGRVPDYDFVAFPPRGYAPVEFFGPDYAWSVFLNPTRFSKPTSVAVRVRVFPLDEQLAPAPTPLEIDAFKVVPEASGIPWLIVFRPGGIELRPESRYWVEIRGLESRKAKRAGALTYLVEFCRVSRPEPAD
ncbi:MAG: hypothetical protein ACE5JG_01275, partial [Planctomycetota bacterium]